MKLVDILAREFKVWPDEYVYISHSQEVGFFASMSGGGCMPLRISDHNFVGQKRQTVTRAEWQAAVDALNALKVVEWDKGSLPPIGSVVEWDGCTFAPEEPQEKDLRVGDQVTIIAHLRDDDFEMAAFTFNPKIHNPARGSIWVNQGAYGCFRRIRTAEQVAAEEREKGIQAIQDAYTYRVESCTHKILHSQAARLYDAGCRLQVAK